MGTIIHHAIVVTSWDRVDIQQAHKVAGQLFPAVTPLIESATNGYRSFLIPPDGSAEGWPDSDAGDAARAAWHAWIRDQADDEGSNRFDCIEIAYGEVESAVITTVNGMAIATEEVL